MSVRERAFLQQQQKDNLAPKLDFALSHVSLGSCLFKRAHMSTEVH